MKTLKDYEREFDNFMLGEYGKWKIGRVEVKQFYRRAFAELMSEAIGGDSGGFDEACMGYEEAKAEIRERIKKMLE